MSNFDNDLNSMDSAALIAEVKKLRAAIRKHRDASGHNLCWFQPELWGLLPDKTCKGTSVPSFPEFIENCTKYRQSLETSDLTEPIEERNNGNS